MAKQNKPDTKKYDQILGRMGWYVDENNPDSVLAEYKRNGFYELRNIYDKRFEAFVKNEYCNLTQQEKTEGYSSKLAKYEREALLADNRIAVYTRLAGSADDTAYFLGDDKNTIIYTNKDGYVAKKRHSKYKFIKKTSTVAQVMPKKSQAENLFKLPHFENVYLKDLTTLDVQEWVNDLYGKSDSTNKDRNPKTVKNIFMNLKAACNKAVQANIIPINPCDGVELKKCDSKKVDPYTKEEVDELMKAMKGDEIEFPIHLDLILGLRRGELLALKWCDIDFKKKQVHIQRNIVLDENK